MSSRHAVVLGLLAGLATALVAGALVVAFGPEVPLLPPSPAPAEVTPAPAAAPPATVGPGAPSPGAPSPGETPGETPTPVPSAPLSPSPGPAALRVGSPAPPLAVPQLAGGTIELGRLRGHPVWIEFMATWCPSCRDEFPLMSGFAARYAETGLVVIAIDVREDVGTVAAFANLAGATFPIGLDVDGAAARAWRVVGLPSHVFIDAQGVVREVIVGGIGPDVMAARLSMIVPGVTVTP